MSHTGRTMMTDKSGWSDQWGLLILSAGLLLFFYWGLDFQGLYGQDSHAYYGYAKSIGEHIEQGAPLPPFYWPRGYPFAGYVLGKTGIPLLFSMQLISWLSLTGTLYVARKIIYTVYQRESWWWLALAGLMQIYFLRSGVVVMSDALALFLVVLSVWFSLRWFQRFLGIDALLFLVFAVGAVCVRMAAAPLLVVPVLFVLWQLWSRSKLVVRVVLVTGLLAGVLVAFTCWNSFFQPVLQELTRRWAIGHIFSGTLIDTDGITHKTVPNGLYVLANFGHPGYLSFGVLLLPFLRFSKDTRVRIIVLTVLVYLIFLSGLGTQNYRFLVLSHPFVLILLFPAFLRLVSWLKKRRWLIFFVTGVVVFNVSFTVYSFRKTYHVFRNEQKIATALKGMIQGDEAIYSFYVDQSFPSYGITNEVRNFYTKEYPSFEKGSLVVFHPSQFQEQWKGHAVMNNWNHLVANYQLDTLCTFESNWTIYRIR